MQSCITHRVVKFDKQMTEYNDIKIFGPNLPSMNHDKAWCYLGPMACSGEDQRQEGVIVMANDPSALDKIVDWEPVFMDVEGQKFSTWRGIPSKPDKYMVVGHFFVKGCQKPIAQQTAGIMAIRKDLVSEREPNHLISKQRLPFAVLTLWDMLMSDRLHVPTGAFVSTGTETNVNLQMALLRFKA